MSDHLPGCARGCTDDDMPRPAITGRLCLPCAAAIRRALRDIPTLTVHAAERTDGRLNPGTETDLTRRAINDAPSSPSPGWDLTEDTLQWALRMVEAHADAADTRPPLRYRLNGVPDPTNITQLCGYIADNLPWYATVIPRDIYDETTGWRAHLEKATGRDRLIHRIKQPCSSCGQRTLTREDGDDWVTCRNPDCRDRWRIDDAWSVHVTAS